MKTPELKPGQMITIAYFIGILVILFIVYRLLSKIGLVQTVKEKNDTVKEDKAVETLRTYDYFNPALYEGKTFKGLDIQTVNDYARALRSSMAGFGTDEEKIYSIFGSLPSKYAISQLSDIYQKQYSFLSSMTDNLKADLLNELDAGEVKTLIDIINSLPNS
jgi:hypothetical protein